jgi:hypothetical protein
VSGRAGIVLGSAGALARIWTAHFTTKTLSSKSLCSFSSCLCDFVVKVVRDLECAGFAGSAGALARIWSAHFTTKTQRH